MKHVITFEEKGEHTFKPGDYVKCINPGYLTVIHLNHIYCVKDIEQIGFEIYLLLDGFQDNSYYEYRFVPATPEEIKQYKFEQTLNKYNL